MPDDPIIMGAGWREWAESIDGAAGRCGVKLIQAHASDYNNLVGSYMTATAYVGENELRAYCMEIIKKQVMLCSVLKIPQIVVHAARDSKNTWKQFRLMNKEFFGQLLDEAAGYGVDILLENGCFPNTRGDYYYYSADMMLTTIDDCGSHPLLNVCWDVGHAHMQGTDQYDEIMEIGNRLKGVHVHDNYGVSDMHAMPFTANCDYDDIIQGLIDCGYGGYFTLEAYALPSAKFAGREHSPKHKNLAVKLLDLPAEILIQGENLMYEITKYMLTQYGCFEE